MAKRSSFWKVFLAFMMTLLFVAGCAPVNPAIKTGVAAPDFGLTSLSGKSISMSKLYGRPVLLVFASASCRPCQDELQLLKALYEQYNTLEVLVIALGFGRYREDTEAWRAYAEKNALEFQIAVDKNGMVYNQYKIVSVPAVLFINNAGTIQFGHYGLTQPAQLDTGLKAIGMTP